MLNSWERQITYCQKYCELLSKKDQQFVNDLSGREPTPSRIRHLNAVTVAIQRDPRSLSVPALSNPRHELFAPPLPCYGR
jgi:hypothetical protein